MPGAPVPASAQPAGNRPAASGQPPSPAQSAATVGHTALPPRQHIRCFECGYEFNLTGRQHSTYCPKCRTTLDLAGYTIDAECRETLKTLGKIRVTPRGSVSSATLMATDMDLQGKISGCNVTVFRLLTVFPGASFVRHEIKTVDLRIEPGTGFSLRKESAFRNVDLAGTLSTNLYSTGVVTLRSTSEFKGEIQRSLPSHRRQQRVGAFAPDDLLHPRELQRFKVDGVGDSVSGHHRGRIGVGEHHLVPLFLQRFDRLHPRVVELARLPDDDGA